MESSQRSRGIDVGEQELTLKSIILTMQEWLRFLWSKKFLIILVAIIGAALGLTYAFIKKPLYKGELTFVMEENSAGPLGAYMGMASQFGIDLSGSGSSGIFQGDNIMVFLKSRLMIEKTLLSPIVEDGKKMTLAEHYIEFNKLRQTWKKPELQQIHFPLGQERTKFSLLQDSILQVIYNTIVKSNLDVDKTAKQYNFISVTCTSLSENFSKVFTESLVDEAAGFYIETKTKKTKSNVDRLQSQADSLEILLNRKTYSAAAVQDLNMNPAKQVASVNVEFAMRDKMVLQTMYGEVVKNLEFTKISMAQETPVIQIVDTPILPLEKVKLGKLKGLIFGGFMGGVLIVFYLLIKKILRDILDGK
ncbi:MAG: lipopolysaccharide biosynthesis protein [Chitinophaga sp.]|uniref:Wzz/FepE/Etk N-terminal domain-containing protein n=1 Tax=Chitinophaga sp. TaxID=1869181 RepID=UPI001B0EB9AB|nr:Wzz/FepE/Etk N-terminal domain-containing protein [Chitinophaga sp.]MBO9731736.1 lipopolysaccharide biosynthesis protein [Chitinophaga sp.]